MIVLNSTDDMQLFVFLSAGCSGFIHAKPALTGASGGKSTAQPDLDAGGTPEVRPHDARFFRASIRQALGGPAAIPQ